MNYPQVKIALHHICTLRVQTQTAELQKSLASLAEARNNETKSSVGDKYETGRAMVQIEEAKAQKQLAQARQIQHQLTQIDPRKTFHQAQLGSLVITNQGKYFISVALGKVALDEQTYYCISAQAPISQLLLQKQAGEKIILNGREIEIQEVY